jgi:hypothetical protein
VTDRCHDAHNARRNEERGDAMSVEELVSQLRSIEEQLRDLAYDRLREAANGDEDAKAEEKKLLVARRGIEKAIRALDPSDSVADDF